MPRKWYTTNIKDPLYRIERYKERINFLYKKKEDFLRLFSGNDADKVLLMIDDLIKQVESNKPTLYEEPFIFLLRQTIDTLQHRQVDWILGTICTEVPFGALQRFNDNARDFFDDYQEQYFSLADTNPTLINRVNAELQSHVQEYEKWKVQNADASAKEPFLYLQRIITRVINLYTHKQLNDSSNPEFNKKAYPLNYTEIVLQGYTDPFNSGNLSNYFFREFKKAEKEYYEAEEFFSNCLKVINGFENNLERQVLERKIELREDINLCKKDNIPFDDMLNELNQLKIDDLSINLAYHTNRKYVGDLSYSDLILIKKAIKDALIKNSLQNLSIENTTSFSTPPIIPSTLTALPPIEKVYFVHYQCDDFEKSDNPPITNLCIYDNIEVSIFKDDEAKSIEEYCQKVDALNKRGLFAIHWNQNRPNYGPAHIKSRYKTLTGNEIQLTYNGSLNLADYLQHRYGENYVPHKRLNSLAKLNGFSGDFETESENKTYTSDRILLLSKIYSKESKGSLKIAKDRTSSVVKDSPLKSDVNRKNNVKNKSNKSEGNSGISINNIFPANLPSSRTSDLQRIGVILFQFNEYFTIESITMKIPFKTIPGFIDREIHRKEVDVFSDFDFIFKREFEKMQKNGHPILPIPFCELEIKKFKKWITDYENLTDANLGVNFTPVYPDGYRRALNYLEYLSKLLVSGQFDFINNQPDDSNNEEPRLPPAENNTDEESTKRIKDAIVDHMEEFRAQIPLATDFDKACVELQNFFENKPYNITKAIFIKNKNITKLAYALGNLHKELINEPISKEYLQLLIQLFSIYKNFKIDGVPLISTNLYKYCTSKNQ